ncbi:MAG: hypothetical protein KDB90_13485 [Planctomycetes bacterium]|nr:hypothetical protein [Planctomycetota bacterium]
MNPKLPRLVIVTRPTPLDMLIRRFGTIDQAKFYVESRGRKFDRPLRAHELQQAALDKVIRAIPAEQRRVQLSREEFDRFLFSPDDVILAVGQDGLVPNIAKYLHGQILIGFNPDHETWPGVLCRHDPADAAKLIAWVNQRHQGYTVEARAMVLATREDGQMLPALNELFVGHMSHQSAKYRIRLGSGSFSRSEKVPDPLTEKLTEERHSSSGVIVSTGTGATGWTSSITRQRGINEPLPAPVDRRLTYMVREPWPSIATGIDINFGFLNDGDELELISEMEEGGVIFGDGIEADYLEFNEGHTVKITIANRTLNLVIPATA